ncbi:MAG: folylpolyglutamate synthase/dihydrofolate synthase family protein [Rikenellaceae bacterium]
MEYKKAIDFLLNIPMFQNVGSTAYNPSLEKIKALSESLGNPHRKFASIHIAGTNGKGSVSNLLASVLEVKGLKVGLYTSPHLLDFRERIKVSSQMISKEGVVEFVEQNRESIEQLNPSFFEVTTAMAFWWFAHEKVDIAVVECGLGGRLDATNIISPLISVITNISKDHTAILGDTIEQIAEEKSGIIKPMTPLILGEWEIDSALTILSKAKEQDADTFIASQRYRAVEAKIEDNLQYIEYNSLLTDEIITVKTNLLGSYQDKNIATALTVLDILNEQGRVELTQHDIEKGFTTCGLQARWQKLSSKPTIICDAGHNQAGVREVVKSLEKANFRKLIIVLAVVGDKDIDAILSLLPLDAHYIFTKSSVARALDENILMKKAAGYSLCGEAAKDVKSGVERAKELAETDDLIFIGGSCFTVADALGEFKI